MEAAITALAASIQAPTEYLPTFGNTMSEGITIDFDGEKFVHVYVDHGLEKSREFFLDPLELIHRVLRDVTWEMAADEEQKDPERKKRDGGKVMFAVQTKLLGKLDAAWRDDRQREIDAHLRVHPFDDKAHAQFFLACDIAKENPSLSYDERMAEAARRLLGNPN
jgi:hypothetical protein